MTYLDFDAAIDQSTTSWERADPDAAMIEQRTETTFGVLLPDGDDAHTVTFRKERGAYVGYCDCDGDKFHDHPCAHLCTLRKAEFIGAEDVHGRTIEAVSTGPGTEPEPELRADGSGQPADYQAGADGQEFGRPEGQL